MEAEHVLDTLSRHAGEISEHHLQDEEGFTTHI